MGRECQEKNAKRLAMVAVGMNKAADELLILDERTREDLASGKYHDQRRGSFGTPAPAQPPGAAPRAAGTSGGPSRRAQPSRRAPARAAPRRPWSASQEKRALIYNEQGLQPAEIARKLGVSVYTATQMILTARNRGKA